MSLELSVSVLTLPINVKQISPFSKFRKNIKNILIADYNNIIDS